jgi:hypothetical protein
MRSLAEIAIILVLFSIPLPAAAHGTTESTAVQGHAPAANQTADEILPNSLADAARDPARGVIDQLKLWKTGSKLQICFMAGSASTVWRIAEVAQTWTTFANLTFDFGRPEAPYFCNDGKTYQIKIGFQASGYWSYIGTDSERRSPSLNLQGFDSEHLSLSGPEFRRLVLHEFGHALGLQHEHQSPEARCTDEINWPAAEEHYSTCCGWSQAETRRNLQTLVGGERYKTTRYDPKSIMHYFLPVSIFRNGRNSRCFTTENYELSAIDKNAIAAAYGTEESQQERKKSLLSKLDTVLKDGGVNQEERKVTIERAMKVLNITVSQVINITGDVKQETKEKCSPAIIGAGNVDVKCQ